MMKNKQAFTLIELLVVVLIICILAAVALPQYQKAVIKARTVELISVLNAGQQAIDAWILENGYKDADIEDLALDIPISDTLREHFTNIDIMCRDAYEGESPSCTIDFIDRGGSGFGTDIDFTNTNYRWNRTCSSGDNAEIICPYLKQFFPDMSISLE